MIPFTQYMRPNGRAVQTGIERPEAVETKARAIIAAGFCFEAEVLSDGMVSLTITNDDADHDIELFENTPGAVAAAVDRMVERFDPASVSEPDDENEGW